MLKKGIILACVFMFVAAGLALAAAPTKETAPAAVKKEAAAAVKKEAAKAVKKEAASAVKKGGTLVYGRGGDSVGLDPAYETDGNSFMICDNTMEALVDFKDESTE